MRRPHAVLGLSLLIFSAAVCGLVSPPRASAHVGHVILRAERYLKLDVSGYDVRVVVSLTLGPAEGRRVLEAADVDGDGEVSSAESETYLAAWGAGLHEELPLSLDGESLELAWGEGYFEPMGAVRPVALTVEMVARFELGGGEETVRFVDRMVRREVFERTDVAFQVRGQAELLASGVEGDADEPRPDLAYPGTFREGEEVALVARIRTPERPDEPWPWVVGVAVLAGLLGGGFAVRHRARR